MLTVYLGARLVSKRPMLVVDAAGVLDRTTPFAVGRLGWDEIVDATFRTDRTAPFVSIEMADPARLLARQGPARRWFIRLGARRWGVVVINSGALDVAPEAMVEAIRAWVRQRASERK